MDVTKSVDFLENPASISKVLSFVKNQTKDWDASHNHSHAQRVLQNGMMISRWHTHNRIPLHPEWSEEDSILLISFCCLVHDVLDHKYVDPLEGEMNIRTFFLHEKLLGNKGPTVDHLVQVINNISFSKETSPDGLKDLGDLNLIRDIVKDSDRLESLGLVGGARLFMYSGHIKRSIEDTIKHFKEKMVKLKDLLVTPPARVLGEQLHRKMVQFIDGLENELLGII